MSISSSLRANAAPQHFERIAKILQAKRNIGDSSTCDVKIQLKNGFDMVHSMVVCAHSTVLADAFAPQRAPYPTLNMMDFDSDSVKRVIDWMYSGEIDIPETNIADVLAVASYLRVTMLQRQIEQKIRNHNGSPVLALNIASARPYSVMDDTMDRLVHNLAEKVAVLSPEEVSKLTVNSVIAVMAAVLPMRKKVPLINMFILWIMTKKPEKDVINTVIQSLVISDITYDALYSIRYSLKQYLTNVEVASKSQLSISPSGTIDIKISTKKNTKTTEKSYSSHSTIVPQQPQFHRTVSEIVDIEKIPDPFIRAPHPVDYRTVSEIEDIRMIPDPFDKSLSRNRSNSNILRRETNGFPKYFTQSEVENLQQMTDQFSRSDKESMSQIGQSNVVNPFSSTKCTAKYQGWSNDIIENNKAIERQRQIKAKFTPSEAQMVRQMPDPFVKSGPVIMRPAVGNTVSSNRDAIVCGNSKNQFGANQSFSGHSLNNNNSFVLNKNPDSRPSPVLSVMSPGSMAGGRSVVSNPSMIGPKKTESEIQEINALPSFNPSSYHTAKTSNSGNGVKEPVDQGQQSPKPQKLPRSQYLYPN